MGLHLKRLGLGSQSVRTGSARGARGRGSGRGAAQEGGCVDALNAVLRPGKARARRRVRGITNSVPRGPTQSSIYIRMIIVPGGRAKIPRLQRSAERCETGEREKEERGRGKGGEKKEERRGKGGERKEKRRGKGQKGKRKEEKRGGKGGEKIGKRRKGGKAQGEKKKGEQGRKEREKN